MDYFGKKLEKGKEMLPSTCRIGGNLFTSMAVIGGKLYSYNHKNLNHVHKDSKYLVSVIITLGKYISGGETVFYDWVKTSDLGSRAHILKHLRGIMIFGPFEKVFHEGTFWSGYWAVISFILTKQIFLHFFRHGDWFYNRYKHTTYRLKYLDDDGYRVKPKIFLQRRMRCTYFGDPIQAMWDRDRRIARDNFGKKRKSTGFIFSPGS